MERLIHPFEPWFQKDSKILMLGTFPSVMSRKCNYYYAHPKNRFWKIMEILFQEKIERPKEFCLKHHIALWDTVESCTISSSKDASIKDVVPMDLSVILNYSEVKYIFTEGKKAHEIYQKYLYPIYHIEDIVLPSTSPANATYSLERLVEEYKIIKKYLK